MAERVESLLHPSQQVAGMEQRQTGGGQLEGERHAVQPRAELPDGARVLCGQCELRVRLLGSLEQERDRRHAGQGVEVARSALGQAEGPDRDDLLAAHAKRRLAGHEDAAQWRRGRQLGHLRRGVEHVLEVVEDQQHPPLPHEFPQADRRRDALLRHAQRAGDRRRHPGRIGDPLEPHEEHPVREVLEHRVARGERQPRLAGAARAGEREQAYVGPQQPLAHGGDLALAADQRGGRSGQGGWALVGHRTPTAWKARTGRP